jgi:carotenoid cleavage dioxygenase-like enzyme
LKGNSLASRYKWQPEKKMRIVVLSRKNGDLIRQYHVEPVFAWHHINSFEYDGTIIIDMAAYQNAETFTSTVDVSQENGQNARFVRYKLGLDTKEVFEKEIGPAIEMPRINYAHSNGKPYDYVWGYDDAHSVEKTGKRGLIKIDTKTKFAHTWSEDNCIADEPLFVANPNGQTEDDGVILATILDTKKKKTFLLILDAKQCKELARAEVPHHIPYTLHGEFIKK